MKRVLTPIAGVLVAVYLVLAVQAAVCLFADTAPQGEGHHHHSDKAAHSALCLWACQAHDGPSHVSASPALLLVFLSLGLVRFVAALASSHFLHQPCARAPPR
ncbi:MAG: hypothetical protein AB1411_07540 [Nitrospirota bacterium]